MHSPELSDLAINMDWRSGKMAQMELPNLTRQGAGLQYDSGF